MTNPAQAYSGTIPLALVHGYTLLPAASAAGTDRFPIDRYGSTSTTSTDSMFTDGTALLGGTRFWIRGALRFLTVGGAVSMQVNAHNPATGITQFDFTATGTALQPDPHPWKPDGLSPGFTAGFSVDRVGVPADDIYLFWTASGIRKG